MHWSKSVSLVVFVLVALLVTSIVGGRVWAQSGGSGVVGSTIFSQVVPTPVSSPCLVPVTTVFTAGVKDNFSTANGAEPSSPSQALATWMADNYPTTQGFDGNTANRSFGHTFMNLPADITGAKLEISLRVIGQELTGNDAMNMYLNQPPASPPFAWGSYLMALNQPSLTWTTGQSATLTLDLAALPGTPLKNILSNINASKTLDVYVQDDTSVDYITLTVETCAPTTTYTYSVKIVCGTVAPPPRPIIPALRDPAPVVPGLYRTAVNIHNFWEKDTAFLQKVAIAMPQDQPRGPVTKKVKATLRPNEAVEVDCYNIVAILEGTTAARADFLKGFLVIESAVELEVTAVYTAKETLENGISIDVEQIQPHVIRPIAPIAATCTPGGTLANGTGIAGGTFPGAGFSIALGATNQITVIQGGTFAITLPAGVTGTANSGSATLVGGVVPLVAGVNMITILPSSVKPGDRFLVILSCQ